MIVSCKVGDIFKADCQTLVVPVNTVGVAGAGLALAFKHRYPGWESEYKRSCRGKEYRRHGYWLWDVPDSGQKLLSAATKTDWRKPSKIEYIDHFCHRLAEQYAEDGIYSIAIPMLGCGLGELRWPDVESVIRHYLEPIDLQVHLLLSPR